MKKSFIIGTLAVVALIAASLWYYSDEKIVLRKTDQLLECFVKEKGDRLLSNALNQNKFRDLLDKQVAIDYGHPDMQDIKGGIKEDRNRLATNYLYMVKSAKSITLTNQNINLISIENDKATVEVTLHGEILHSRKALRSEFSILIDYSNTDKGWLISSIKIQK